MRRSIRRRVVVERPIPRSRRESATPTPRELRHQRETNPAESTRLARAGTDALGEAVGANVVVRGRIGPLRVVDVSGNPISVVVSDDGSLIRDQLYMPESGEFVLFLGPLRSDGTRLLNWREAISNGIVSGANTVLLRDVSIEALRRSGAPDAG